MATEPVLIDFESRSRAPLKRVGGRLYWAHPSTEALCCAWHDTRDGTTGVWLPGEEWPHAGRVLAAHNAKHFDRFGADRYGFGAVDWIDTSDLARRSGIPGNLDALGTRLGYSKDKVASRFTVGLSTVRRPGKAYGSSCVSAEDWRVLSAEQHLARGVQAPLTVDAMVRVAEYCARDVEIMARAWDDLRWFLDVDSDVERCDRVVNDRGVAFDGELARALLHADDTRSGRVLDDCARRLGVSASALRDTVSSPARFCDATGLDNAQKTTIDDAIRYGFALMGDTYWYALARQATASIVRGKLEAGLTRVCPDGRLRDMHQYYGGHTGRWSGRGFQPHNLTRPNGRYGKWSPGIIDTLARNAVSGRRLPTADQADLLLRATLVAPPGKSLAVCDFSGVEARALAWAADDQPAIGVFQSGRDPYKVAASIIYGVDYSAVTKPQRDVGKIAELALGYQGGEGAFSKFAEGYGIDLSALDVPAIIRAWRSAHSPCVNFWYACQRAFIAAAEGGHNAWAGPFEFVPSSSGADVAVYLPSGRPLVYRDAHVLRGDGARPQCAHYGQVKAGLWGTVYTYGGKLTENLIQAFCRDLMADAMVRVEDAGLPVVLTVHDEIVCEAPAEAAQEAYEYLRHEMTTLPAWAAGFPIGASGYWGARYKK